MSAIPTVKMNGHVVCTPEQAATKLGISLPTLNRRVKEGTLPKPHLFAGRRWFEVKALEDAITRLPKR